MYQKPHYISIGFIKKNFGYSGEMACEMHEDILDHLEEIKFLFIEIDGCPIPFELEHFEIKNDLILKFVNLDSPEETKKLLHKKILLEESQMAVEIREEFYAQGNLENFVVYDNDKKLGIITEIEEYPSQLMAKVLVNQNIVLIPLVEEFITNIDTKSKKLYLSLPTGLI